ncbi:envelope-like protein, partial [Trifolium medium]|nr:envelope-like protein [Trifolium medium]
MSDLYHKENPFESINDDPNVKTYKQTSETLGKENPHFDEPHSAFTSNVANDPNLKIPSSTGDMSDDAAVPTKANFDFVPENVNMSEKEKSPENMVNDNASDNNTVVNSHSKESMKTVSENFDNESVEKDKSGDVNVIDIYEVVSKDKSAEKTPTPSIAKRLRSNTGKAVSSPNKLARTTRAAKKTSEKLVNFGPPRSSSKVTISCSKGKKNLKRKEPPSRDSEFEEEAVKVTTGLMKTVKDLGSCYERLVKEFLINIDEECNDPTSPDYRKVYVRGRCTEFSPDVINQFLG